jgi:hypothetical protein
MKLLIVFSLPVLLAAAEGQAAKQQPASRPAAKQQRAKPAASQADGKPAASTVKPVEIPANAVEFEPGSYRATDAAGKTWIYRKTPFGVARMEDKPDTQRAAQTAELAEQIKVTEAGDSLKFERPGPFGMYQWQKKKSELNDNERAAWERSRNPSPGKEK